MSGSDNTLAASSRVDVAAAKLGVSSLALLLANAGVLSVYFIYDVTLFQLILVYWCECLWIGVFSALKLLAASIVGRPFENRWADVSRGAALFMSILVIGFAATAFFSLLGIMLLAILFANDALVLSTAGDAAINHIGLVLGVSGLLLAGHAVSFVGSFLLLGEFRTARAATLITLPFRRCFALFAVIILSLVVVALVPLAQSTGIFAVIVIVLKTGWDYRLHLLEREEFRTDRQAQLA